MKNIKTTNTEKKHSKLLDFRDLVRLMTVLLFLPWFGLFSEILFGTEVELETEIAVLGAFVLFGTFWCGWICPFGNASYFVSRIGQKLFPRLQVRIPGSIDKPLRYLKYIFLAMFLYIFIQHNVNYFFDDHMVIYKSTPMSSWYIWFKKYAILLIPLLIPRFFCKYLCFQKAGYNIINRIFSFVTIKRDEEKCIGCGKCDNSCPMEIKISQANTIKGSDCVGCFNCVDEQTCPDKADAMSLCVLGKKINPLYFAAIAMILYYAITLCLLHYLH